MESPKHQVFWYTTQPLEKFPPLRGDLEVDVAVVGGGMAGLSAAHRLRQEGFSVAVLEKDFCGAGASGKSSGFITPDSELELGQLIRRFGPEKAKKLWEFAISGVGLIHWNIQEYSIACDYQPQDSLFIASTKNGFEDVVGEYEARTALGYTSTLYNAQEVRRVVGSNGYAGAVRYPDTFGINSYRYCTRMKQILLQQGVRIYEGTNVQAICSHEVIADRGRTRAKYIVIAADRFIPDLGRLKKSIYHGQTFLMASAPLSDHDVKAVFPDMPFMVWDTDLIYQYWRLMGGNRLLLGGGSVSYTYMKKEKERTGGMVRKLSGYFAKKFPAVRIGWEFIWPGLIGITKDLLPMIGQDREISYLYYVGATAGLPWSAAGGNYIAEKIAKGRDDYDEFFSPCRKFFIGDGVQSLLGTKAAFGISNFWSKYYQKG